MKRILQNSFYRKNQMSLFIFILLPLATVSFMASLLIKDVVIDKIQSSRQNVIDVMASDLNKNIEDIVYSTNLFSYKHVAHYKDLLAFKDLGKLASSEDYQRYMRISELLDMTFSKTTSLKAKVFYVNKEDFTIGIMGEEATEYKQLYERLSKQVSQEWIEKANPGRIYWMPTITEQEEEGNSTKNYYFFVKVIKDYQQKDYVGVLYVGLPYRYFEELFSKITDGQIELLDAEHTAIYRYTEGQGKQYSDSYIQLEAKVSKLDWSIQYKFSSNEVTKEITNIFIVYGSLLSICILIFLLLSILYARRLHRPLFMLRRTAEQFGGGNRLIRFPNSGKAKDEIAVLGNAFNTMLDQINELIANVEQEQEEKRIIELQALFSQIQPHFLLNTLNSIKCELYLADDEIRGKQVEALMSLLRAYMRINEESTLEQECKLLHDYVDIMRVRSSLDLELAVHLDPQCESVKVPRLLLQPLVENAIVHGFADPPDKAKIEVEIKREYGDLLMSVSDNGMGMSEERLVRLLSSLESYEPIEANHGVGLINSKRRLELAFQTKVTMHAVHNSASGMKFTVCAANVFAQVSEVSNGEV